jgi:hypothetical protein
VVGPRPVGEPSTGPDSTSYPPDLTHWEPVARAHGERFADIQPANTMVRGELIGEAYLVEIQAEAILGTADGNRGH